MSPPQATGLIRFGGFEVDALSATLRKHGTRVRLQDQPFRVLLALLERPGELITREELHQRVWAGESFGDFDHSLNIAVNKLRDALGDSAEAPRFVETIPRRGYRFIAEAAQPVPAVPLQRVRKPEWSWVAGLAALLLIGVGLGIWLGQPATSPSLQWHRVTNDSLRPKENPVLTDGSRVYFKAGVPPQIYAAPVAGGESVRLPFVLPAGPVLRLLDLSPDGQELLVLAYPAGDTDEFCPLWTIRIADGSSRRVGDLAAAWACYSPDGHELAFTAGGVRTPGELWVASSDGTNARKLHGVKGLRLVVPVWSPDGARIGFGQNNLAAQEWTSWEIGKNGTGLRRMVPDWHKSHFPAGWTPSGSLFLTSEGQFWMAPRRRFFQLRDPRPLQLSTGEPFFFIPVQLHNHSTFYARGESRQGQLQRFAAQSRTWEPLLGGISADSVEYARDGLSVAYATYPQAQLWVRRADGSRPVQVTKSPMLAWLPRWSPDGAQIAFTAKPSPNSPWSIFLVNAAGGIPRPACQKDCGPQGDLAWAPDGKSIVYALPTDSYYSGGELYLRVLNLETGVVTKLPGSDGLFSPRWSPDGSSLLAVRDHTTNGWRPLMLYHFASRRWEELKNPGIPNWPAWSHDGSSVWYYDGKTIMRYDLRTKETVEVLPLSGADTTGNLFGVWFGLTANDEPMILRRQDVVQIYKFEWKSP
jgi:DNA-binding winged helix-turn-helix (wHTH) protein/Tol biopolymer transport system component